MRALPALAGTAVVAGIATPAALAQQWTPLAPESGNADAIRDSYLFISIFILGVFLLVHVLLVAFIVRYRRRRRERFQDGVQIHGSMKLEVAWTVFPVLILVAIATFVFVELPGITDPPSARASDELRVRVEGRQFYWQYEYPNGVVAIDRLRAPAGVPVRLEITAPEEDVIHSWWIPQLGGKIDAIPGTVTETWFQAARTGTYPGQCAELCGIEHAKMLATVEVVDEAEFDSWLQERASQQGDESVALGEEEWEGACAKCHGTAGEGGIAPRIAGSPLLSDRAALERIVRNGVRTMPAVGTGWSEQQMRALIAYLRESPPSGS